MRLYITLIVIFFQYADGTILVSRLESCANSMIKLVSTINSIDDGHQVFNVNYSASIPNGDNLRAILKGSLFMGSKWIPLFMFTEEKGVCAMLEKHFGPLFAEILQAAAMVPGCPVSKGIHIWRNYKPNTEKMRLVLPQGKVKLRIEGIEKSSGKLGLCLNAMLNNK